MCGIAAVWNHNEASNLVYLALHAQQHRGQEGVGIVSLNEFSKSMSSFKQFGLVQEVFSGFDFSKLAGRSALGHIRYSTSGGSNFQNIQPFQAEISSGQVCISHNGNITNADKIRKDLISKGAIFNSTSDTEIILHLMALQDGTLPKIDIIKNALKKVEGAFSLLIMFNDTLFAVRDPNGFRPLSYANLDSSLVFASESCAFDLLDAEFVRDVEAGEILEVNSKGDIKSHNILEVVKESKCVFEHIYFAKPDSFVFNEDVTDLRNKMGRELAREFKETADFVIGVPDSGNEAALGFAEESGIAYKNGIVRNRYVGRTFIEPQQSIRDFGVKLKFNAKKKLLNGKDIIVIDDSIVRGTTSRKIVKMLKGAGVKKIHFLVSSPPITDPCFYGIDTPNKDELIASNKTVEEIKEYLKVDSLYFLSKEGLFKAVNGKSGFCDACFTGDYPVVIGKKTKQTSIC